MVVLHFGSRCDDTFDLIDWLHENRSFGELILVAIAHPDQPDLWERAYEAGIEVYHAQPIPASRWRALAKTFPRCWGNGHVQD